jgi:sec-independent protein translocase protein TatA
MLGLGTSELIIILLLVMVLFGASKIPQLGRGLGEGIRNFRKGLKGGEDGEGTPTDTASSGRDAPRSPGSSSTTESERRS